MNWYSSISPELKKKVLFRGMWWAGSGAILLLLTGILMPLPLLKQWGFVIFVLAACLIGLGLTPYRRLMKKEMIPDKLRIEGDFFEYWQGSRLAFQVATKEIKKITYRDSPFAYGIAIRLTAREESPLVFFPYFTKRAYEEIVRVLTDQPE